MANKPLLLTDNLVDTTILNRSLVLSNPDADDAAGREVWRVADNLRDLTSWSPTTTNVDRKILLNATAAAVNVASTIVILDRGHNWAGKTIVGEVSNDNVSWSTIFTSVIPATAGGLPGDANGCSTPEGVWWKGHGGSGSWNYVRFRFAAGGAGVAPTVTGLHVGLPYRSSELFNAPGAYDYRRAARFIRNEVSKGGVRVKGNLWRPRLVKIDITVDGGNYAAVQTEINRICDYNAPVWFCLDDSDTNGSSLLAMLQLPGDTEYVPEVNPYHRTVQLDLEEVIPQRFI